MLQRDQMHKLASGDGREWSERVARVLESLPIIMVGIQEVSMS